MQGRFTVGMILAFQGFLNSFMAPAASLIAAGQTLQEMRTDMERVEDVMNYPEDVIWGKADGKEPEACLKKSFGKPVANRIQSGRGVQKIIRSH